MDIATAINILEAAIKLRTDEVAALTLALESLKGNFAVQFVETDNLVAEKDAFKAEALRLAELNVTITESAESVIKERDALAAQNTALSQEVSGLMQIK